MKISQVLIVNAILFIAIGIGFTLYAPNALAFYGVSDLAGDNQLLYWNIIAFARMFGAALLAFGLVLFGIHNFFTNTADPDRIRRELLFSLLFSFIILSIVAITQQFSVWASVAGWITIVVFVIFLGIYIYFIARRTS